MNYKAAIANNFSRAARTYDGYAVFQNGLARILEEQVREIRAANSLLDVGTGTGTLALRLAGIFPESTVHGCDIADGMLGVANEKRELANLDNFVCIRADAEHLPYKGGAFDVVASNSALQWAPEPSRAFCEIFRVLAKGGYLLATVVTRGTLVELRESLKAAAKKYAINFPNGAQLLPGDDKLLSAVKDAGFCGIAAAQIEEKRYYENPRELLLSLKRTGANYSTSALPRRILLEAMSIYGEAYGGGNGIPATFKALSIRARK